jgi:hypothetical protein
MKVMLAAAILAVSASSANPEGFAMGLIRDASDTITVKIINAPSAQSSRITFDQAMPLRFEMTSGLKYFGHICPGQTVCLVYSGDLKDGLVSMLLFNPGLEESARLKSVLGPEISKGRFRSKDGRFVFIFDQDTLVTDSNGEEAAPCEGQDILAWFDAWPTGQSKEINLKKAAILLAREAGANPKELRILANGDVCVDDGPIASLNGDLLSVYIETGAVPARLLAEALGFKVFWNQDSVFLAKDKMAVSFGIGSSHYEINGQYAKLAAGTFWLRDGIVMADISFIGDIAGLAS